MSTRLKQNPNVVVVIFLGIWLLLNIIQGIFTPIANDEAYYWMLAKDLDWGYFDHPPLFALLTWMGINTLGDSEIGVRFFTIALQPLYLYIFWTLVRTERSTWRTALRYCLIAFSIPMLQLYGFVTTPDAPLMMTIALSLWSYKRFIDPKYSEEFNRETIINILLMGASFAAMAYAKYHGALIVILMVMSNLKLLTNIRFWIACLAAVIFIIPHLVWQWNHDFVSFEYHLSGRNGIFEWGNVFEYLLNLLATFNPFLMPVFLVLLFKRRKNNITPFERTLHWVSWGFILFFLLSTLRGYVQPQWIIPLTFAMLFILTRACDSRPALARYCTKLGLVMVVLFLATRIFAMSYDGTAIKLEIFGERASYEDFAKELDGRSMIFDDSYVAASKLNYFNNNPLLSYAYPSIYTRSSQYQLMDMETHLHGKKVARELSIRIGYDPAFKSYLDSAYFRATVGKKSFYYDTIDFYIPVRMVDIEFLDMPAKVMTGQVMAVKLTIENPYDYDIPMIGSEGFSVVMQLRQGRYIMHDITVPAPELILLPAKSKIQLFSEVVVPPHIETGEYKIGFTLQRYPFGSWYNSRRVKIQIVNPKSRV